jgi:hypothetical protein
MQKPLSRSPVIYVGATYVGKFTDREFIFEVFDEANRYFEENGIPLRFVYLGKLELGPGYLINIPTENGNVKGYPLEAIIEALYARLVAELQREDGLAIDRLFYVHPELVGLRIEYVVLSEVPEHVEVPLALQVGLQVSPAFPLLIHHHTAGVVEVSSPEVMNAAFFGVGTLDEFLAFDQCFIAHLWWELNDSCDNNSRHNDFSEFSVSTNDRVEFGTLHSLTPDASS